MEYTLWPALFSHCSLVVLDPGKSLGLAVRRDVLRLVVGFLAAVRVKEVVALGGLVHRRLVTCGIAEFPEADLLHNSCGIGIERLGLRLLDHDTSPLIFIVFSILLVFCSFVNNMKIFFGDF